MRTLLRRTRGPLAAAALLAAMGFGASTALASPARVPECTDPGANGACSSNLGCQRICDRAAPGSIGNCNTSTYCCYCTEW